MGLPLRAWVEKTDNGVEKHGLSSKENVPGAEISEEGHTESFLWHKRINHYWYPRKRCFLLPNHMTKFTLFIELP